LLHKLKGQFAGVEGDYYQIDFFKACSTTYKNSPYSSQKKNEFWLYKIPFLVTEMYF